MCYMDQGSRCPHMYCSTLWMGYDGMGFVLQVLQSEPFPLDRPTMNGLQGPFGGPGVVVP